MVVESRVEVVEDRGRLSVSRAGIAGGIEGALVCIAADVEATIGVTLWEDVELVVLVKVS